MKKASNKNNTHIIEIYVFYNEKEIEKIMQARNFHELKKILWKFQEKSDFKNDKWKIISELLKGLIAICPEESHEEQCSTESLSSMSYKCALKF